MYPPSEGISKSIAYKHQPLSSRRFTGREGPLKKLLDYFSPRTERPQCLRVYLLYGMGGIGKTQICLKFIEESSNL